MVKIGINGFGRIGRMTLRACLQENVDVLAINDAYMNADYMAYLFMYDSTHGRFKGCVKSDEDRLIVKGKTIQTFRESDPKEIPWGKLCVDYVVESSGVFTTVEKASLHLSSGAKRVVITALSPDAPLFVYSVNMEDYDESMKIVSIGSCSVNAAATVLKVIQDNFCIVDAFVTSVHSLTSSQKTVDGPSVRFWRDGRGAKQNIIPACSGTPKALGKVIPHLNGKVAGIAFRVPVADVSLVDMTFRVGKPTTYDSMISAIKGCSDCGLYRGVLKCTSEDVVSSDFINNPASAIVDANAGMALNEKFFKLVVWFDNEYSVGCRVVDVVRYMAAVDSLK